MRCRVYLASGDVGHRTVRSSAGRLSRVRSTSAASGGEDGSGASACASPSGSGASAYASCGGAQGKDSCRPRRRRPCLWRRIAAIFREVWCEGEFCGGPSEEPVSSMVCLDVCEDPCQLTGVDQRVTPCFGANGHAGTRGIAPWTSKVSVGLSALQAARKRDLNDLFATASRNCRVSVWPRKCSKKKVMYVDITDTLSGNEHASSFTLSARFLLGHENAIKKFHRAVGFTSRGSKTKGGWRPPQTARCMYRNRARAARA